MLEEYRDVRQVAGEPARRWFGDPVFDLIVWLDEAGATIGFQLCYDKGLDERALTWTEKSGFSHRRVDDGESMPEKRKRTPVLVPDGVVDAELLARRFSGESGGIDAEIVDFVVAKIREGGESGVI